MSTEHTPWTIGDVLHYLSKHENALEEMKANKEEAIKAGCSQEVIDLLEQQIQDTLSLTNQTGDNT